MEFAVRNEARFLSHRETMRLMARAAARAGVPMKFSQGFNPRRRISLPLPRPVGVAGLAERAILELAEPMAADEASDRLAGQLPAGLELIACRLIHGAAPRAAAATYRLEARAEEAATLRRRVDAWNRANRWPIRRPSRKSRRAPAELDLKGLARIAFDGAVATIRLRRRGDTWARPDEVLHVLALAASDRARLVRTAIQWTSQTTDVPADAG